jgi:glycosyltransferase involved in cell wall biosynthesis
VTVAVTPEILASGRVALLTSSMEGGGAQRAVLKLAAGLAERGAQVDLVLRRAEGPYLAQLPDSVRVVDLHARRMLAGVPALTGYLRRERPVVMLSALDYVNVVALWVRRGARVPVRLVVSERNNLSAAVQHTTRWRTRLMPRLIHGCYPWADGIVAVSHGVADDLAATAALPRERIDVIYNPVVTAEVASMREQPADHSWLTDGGPPVVLGVGRFVPQKDFATLVRAFAEVRSRRPARLLIIGDGPGRPELERLVRDLGVGTDVDLPGFRPNPYAYMSRADVFVLSSRWEGLPGALIEALFCGVRVIATDCPSGPREVLSGGRHGQLVDVGDVRTMAEAIDRALARQVPVAEATSWRPFEQRHVVDQYIAALFGGAA